MKRTRKAPAAPEAAFAPAGEELPGVSVVGPWDFADDTREDEEVQEALAGDPRELPSWLLYDERGCSLYGEIMDLPAYTLPARESALLHDCLTYFSVVQFRMLIDVGCGDARKTRLLLESCDQITRYVPLDISLSAVSAATTAARDDVPAFAQRDNAVIYPVCGDFRYDLLHTAASVAAGASVAGAPSPVCGPCLIWFPGSTIGNLGEPARHQFYETAAAAVSACGGGALLIGADLVRPAADILACYDDPGGVTARFDLNVLRHVNRRWNADFPEDAYRHVAVWNAREERAEMHLEAMTAHTVHVPDLGQLSFKMEAGASIRTEIMQKFTEERFRGELHAAGLQLAGVLERDHYALILATLR
jgi:L-histidine Nalpha-methyltransferase